MIDTPAEQASASWIHYPWVWLVFAIPLLTIVAGFITFYLASDTRDSLISENYYREGLAINQQTDRLRHAAELGVTAELDLGRNQAYLQINLHKKKGTLPDTLSLGLYHPTLQEYDQQLMLHRVGSGHFYRVTRPRISPGRWYVSLAPEDQQWRLQGQMQLPLVNGKFNFTP